MPVKILDHTSDIKILVYGDDISSIFKDSTEEMAKILYRGNKFPKNLPIKHNIKLESKNPTSLLINFLNEILTKSYINMEVYPKVNITSISDTKINAEIFGFKTERFYEDIKSVTFHEANIVKDGNVFKTNIIFDI